MEAAHVAMLHNGEKSLFVHSTSSLLLVKYFKEYLPSA